MESKPAMSISHEEQTSIRALAGTVEETVDLTQSLYKAVVEPVPGADAVIVVTSFEQEEHPTRKALKAPGVPTFDEEDEPKH